MGAAKRRRLSDLYVVGAPLTFEDPDGGEDIEVWLQKPDPVQHDEAIRASSAARTRVLIQVRDRTSERWLAQRGELMDSAEREQLIDLAIRDDMAVEQARAEAEVGAEEEWDKDDYLQGLVDAWNGIGDQRVLKEVWARDHDDADAKRVHDEIERFDNAVTARIDAERERMRLDWEGAPEDTLLDIATEKLLERQAMKVFADEYDVQTTYYFTREPGDHKVLYFESPDEVRRTDDRIRMRLTIDYQKLIVETQEGKGSAGTPASSPSSDQPVAEGTPVSSGPEDAPQ